MGLEWKGAGGFVLEKTLKTIIQQPVEELKSKEV